MIPDYDVVTVGGSISGLLASREIAESGFKVKVLEDDLEIGLPEKCDGLVSIRCLEAIGIAPTSRLIQNNIKKAVVYSPNGSSIEIDASNQGIVVLDRSKFDRELAKNASNSGAEIELGQRVNKKNQEDKSVTIFTETASYTSKWVVNAVGYSALPILEKKTLPAAKFEVYGTWFKKDTIEIYFDQRKTPGYFLWVIPISSDIAKVGSAGIGVNQFQILDDFIKERKGSVVKKTAAQIVVGGPINQFVSGNIVTVGDAAGQAKPTTGGGIYSGGVGGILAGKYLSESLSSDDNQKIFKYEKIWRKLFNKEFRSQSQIRGILNKIDNSKIDKIFNIIKNSNILERISLESDFDYHSFALLKTFGVKNAFQITSLLADTFLDSFRKKIDKKT
ncbi:MAG TPA: NAD(P)/FAD-dependent oxidoreductase [Nitrososphaerales archaeon]